MKNSLQTFIISLLVIITMPMTKLTAQVSIWDGTWEPWTHGTGSEADPFLIENAQQLAYLAYRVNNGLDAGGGHVSSHNLHYKLMVDIDLNGNEDFQWTPIGYFSYSSGQYDYQHFGGCFNGNGHEVKGLFASKDFNGTSGDGISLFALIDNAIIKNLKVSGIVSPSDYATAGGIIGRSYGISQISNCCSAVDIFRGYYSGGIIGHTENDGGKTIINNCYNTGSVTGTISGGIVGCTGGVQKSNSSSRAAFYISDTEVVNCYNTGCISGEWRRGGIVGEIGGYNCYGNTTVNNCYYLSSCGGNNSFGGQPMSADAMQSIEFVETLNTVSCFWEPDQTSINNGYPVLTMISCDTQTLPATEVDTASATLHGFVSIENTSIVSKGFEYKRIEDLEYSIIEITDDNNNFSFHLSGLDINSTFYQYRTFVNITDCDVTTYGSTELFEVSWMIYDTILINNIETLRWVAEQCNNGVTFEGKYIKLMNDIELPLNVPNNMISIGSYPDHPFKGTFDGNGKLIYNLYIDQPNTPYQGFFGYTLNANLYNVGLVNITASGRNYTGGMVAFAENTHMRDCYVNGGTLFALSYCGGLVGYQEQGTSSIISGCYNTCTVSGNHYVGGLVGFSNYGTVRNSYVAAPVSGQGNGIGAIIGGANEVLMYNCYFSTEITGQTNAIGENNFKDGEGLTNAQMRDPQFVETLNQGLVTPVWKSDYYSHINNGFPIIKWQRPGTSVEENEAAKNIITLYPNPAIDFVTIQSDDPSISLQHAEFYDVNGRKVMSVVLDGQKQEFSIDKLNAGIYSIRIQTSNGCYTNLKLIVQ